MIVFEDGSIEGTIGGGSLELKVMEDAKKAISENKASMIMYDLDEDLSMHCGGTTGVYFEPIVPQLKLFLFGAGHIGKALVKYAPDFGFNITLIDHRTEIMNSIDEGNMRLIVNDYLTAIKDLDFDLNTFIVIVTPKHAFDEEVLAACANKPFAYLGMIGSKTKVALARKRLVAENKMTEEQLNKVDMPIGIKFNAQTPEEIAISILAKLIDVKNSKFAV